MTTTTQPSPLPPELLPTNPHYTFPPFYTLQPNLTTRTAQLNAWTSLLLAYCTHTHTFRLSTSHPIFLNASLNRRLAAEDVKVLWGFMRERGRCEFITSLSSTSGGDAASGGGSGAGGPVQKGRGWLGGVGSTSKNPEEPTDEVHIFYLTAAEWASSIYDWVEETGQKGAVLTVFEMVEGEQSRGRRWEGMPDRMFRRCVEVLVKRGRAAVLGSVSEGEGVKFF